MAEIINYKDTPLSLGTEFNLWHVSYPKLKEAFDLGQLSCRSKANLEPHQYLEPNAVFRFRFNFPDEAAAGLGTPVIDCFRSVTVLMDNGVGTKDQISISKQKCLKQPGDSHAYLAILYSTPNAITYIADQPEDARTIVRQIIRNHVIKEQDPASRAFYRAFAMSILKGYRKNIQVDTLTADLKNSKVKEVDLGTKQRESSKQSSPERPVRTFNKKRGRGMS